MNNKLRLRWVLNRDAALICSRDANMRNATLNHWWRRSSGSSRKTRESQLFGRDADLAQEVCDSGPWEDAALRRKPAFSIKEMMPSSLWKDVDLWTRPLSLCKNANFRTQLWIIV